MHDIICTPVLPEKTLLLQQENGKLPHRVDI
jgi:hypothetical protein